MLSWWCNLMITFFMITSFISLVELLVINFCISVRKYWLPALHRQWSEASGRRNVSRKIVAARLSVSVASVLRVQGTPCDLVTGDERRCVSEDGVTPSAHVACTVEMTSVSTPCNCCSPCFLLFCSVTPKICTIWIPTVPRNVDCVMSCMRKILEMERLD